MEMDIYQKLANHLDNYQAVLHPAKLGLKFVCLKDCSRPKRPNYQYI